MKRLMIVFLIGLFFIPIYQAAGAEPALQPNPAPLSGAANSIPAGIRELLGIDGRYDSHPVLMGAAELERLEKILKSLPQLKAEVKFKVLPNEFGYAEGEEVRTTTKAAGIFMADRYILSIAHFVTFPNFYVKTPFGSMSLPVEIKEKKVVLCVSGRELELREVKIDPDQDWALFELPKELWGKNPAPKLGKSAELKPGHFLYLLGHPLGDGTLLRSGIVEAEFFELKELGPAVHKDDAFALSGGIYPGDSGGPVFALRDGELELVGIMKSTRMYTNIGHALKIVPLLEKIKAATGIDLRR